MTDHAAPDALHTTCRLCEARCGRLAHFEADGRLVLSPDPQDPVAGAFPCAVAEESPRALNHPQRLLGPMRRDASGSLVPASWEEAFADIGQRLGASRSRHGARSLGLYLGESVQRRSRTLARSLAVGVALGTPNIFSTLSNGAGPRLRMTELMLGQATPLLADVGRAHYVLVLGEDPLERDWGPLQAGATQGEALRFSRKTKGTKLVVASPRKGPLADQADQHLAIHPGTEGWLLLGLLSAIVKGGWTDAQYLRDYSLDLERLSAVLSAFPAERCAEACGIEPAQLAGVALKFSRAAMAVVHPGHGCFSGELGSVAAWAWICLHTVTANMLRPGGIYAHPGLVDLQLAIQAVRTEDAPRTRVGGHPLLLLQAPGAALADEALSPGDEQLRALICVEGDPLLDQPDSARGAQALRGLDLLVCLSSWRSPATEHAHWILPVAHPWEEEELHLLDNTQMPVDLLAQAPALVDPPEGARSSEQILRAIVRAAHPGARGSVFGAHFAFVARFLAGAELGPWEERLVDWVGGIELEALAPPPHRIHKGDTNRAEWRVGHDDGRIRLVPPEIEPLLASLEPMPVDPELRLRLRTSARGTRAPDPLHLPPGGDPGLRVHPDLGLPEGARVQVRTRYGRIAATVRLDPRLRPDTVDLPMGFSADAMALLSAELRDALTGAARLDGLACAVELG